MTKKLSIITINYNNLDGLKRTVESVVNQTWQEFEYIVIDGYSTDGSREYIEGQSEHIDYWVSEPDKGIYNAMNKGIAKASGEYLLFLNSGDPLFSNTVLHENHNAIRDHDFVYFEIEFVEQKTSKIVAYPAQLNFSFFYIGTLCHQSTFIKKTLFDVYGFYDENFRFVSDWKFFIEALFKNSCSYLKVDSILTSYYLDGISSDLANQKLLYEERQQLLNSEFKGHIEDINELFELRKTISNLRKSKKIGLLVKLGLLHKF
ncbi:glycosyltransferase [Flavobacterium sp. RSP49]|uniref:glycosyltransferase family 2 protein n=1 Tax=Flavobacterium sp. RSP49 TaxID=2497487 RepID=UPI000F819DED|nr:glycosyltransferase family 2 protein [Flavobacterium sp. RSP49]RTZ02916.1 glycosyltransferase [Flavobacterium sp. RSP49]